MSKTGKIIILIILIVLIGILAWILVFGPKFQKRNTILIDQKPDAKNQPSQTLDTTKTPDLSQPLDRANERVTKKPFGIHITPEISPIQPEKFTGYHTGTDYEIFAGEENQAVEVKTICEGKLLAKRQVSGYGGVAIQACLINGQTVTVVYGHIKLESVTANINDDLSPDQTLAILGQGYSTETSGERKHLHLGIHKGSGIELKGYVQNESQLSEWLNPLTLLK